LIPLATLLGSALTEAELTILRNVRDGKRANGIDETNRRRHDEALVVLVRRGFVEYNPDRPLRFRFGLTDAGERALDAAESRHVNGTSLERAR